LRYFSGLWKGEIENQEWKGPLRRSARGTKQYTSTSAAKEPRSSTTGGKKRGRVSDLQKKKRGKITRGRCRKGEEPPRSGPSEKKKKGKHPIITLLGEGKKRIRRCFLEPRRSAEVRMVRALQLARKEKSAYLCLSIQRGKEGGRSVFLSGLGRAGNIVARGGKSGEKRGRIGW